MNESKETIAVDANPLFSALRGGRARNALYSKKFRFLTTEYTTWEVKKYIPEISADTGMPESELFEAFDRFPIASKPANDYDEKRKHAEELIAHRDPKDVDILALALKFDIPIWTNDRHFNNLSEVKIFTTAEIFAKMAALAN